MNSLGSRITAAIGAVVACGAVLAAPAFAQPKAAPGFTVKVFATPPAGVSAPDSLATIGGSLWVSYGNHAPPDGSSGFSTVIQYTRSGVTARTVTIKGHSDGLRLNPTTGVLWSLQNEDKSPNLVLIEGLTGRRSAPIPLDSVNGGGFDDVAFIDGVPYISASNPTLNGAGVNVHPALVEGQRTARGLMLSSALQGDAEAVNVVTGKPTKLNLTDPDSLIATPSGDLLLDSQADGELVLIHVTTKTGPLVEVTPLLNGVQVDDTAYATSTSGTLFVADTAGNAVYALSSDQFEVGQPYSASTGVGNTVPAYVGKLSLATGALTPILTGLVNPHGMAFMPRKR